MNTKEMKEFIQRSFPYSENTDSLDTSALGYTLYMGDSPIDKIKVDFFYTEKFIFPIQEIDHIRIADIREIAAMKLSAITEEEPRQKDFWDIHELNEKYSFKDMIDWGIKRNEWSVTEEGILNGFQNSVVVFKLELNLVLTSEPAYRTGDFQIIEPCQFLYFLQIPFPVYVCA